MKSKFEEEIKIIEDWDDDLIWCPSQCYLKFTYKGKHFVIYLRWRHTDPWTATLIEPQEKDWCLHENSKWHELKVPFFKDDELERLKIVARKEAITLAKDIYER